MDQKLFIFGVGHLARKIIKNNQKYTITGTYRNAEKVKDLNINLLSFNLDENIPDLTNYNRIIINFPPQEKLFNFMRSLVEQYEDKEIIFISSTSVFGAGESDENSSLSGKPHSGPYLLTIEEMLKDRGVIVIRPGGLVDEKRNPINFFKRSGKVSSAQNHINYIHTDDVARFVLKDKFEANSYNLVSPFKHIKNDFYSALLKSYNLNYEMLMDNTPDRLINSIRPEVKDFNFLYPNLLDYFLELSELNK